MNNEKKFIRLTPFKMQVLQSFPFIDEDFDAITNYELLCKVVEYLNQTVNNVDLLNEKVEEFENYFDNLDVQDEINNKLDEMATDGTLAEIINQEIFSDLNNKIEKRTIYTSEFRNTYLNDNDLLNFCLSGDYSKVIIDNDLTLTSVVSLPSDIEIIVEGTLTGNQTRIFTASNKKNIKISGGNFVGYDSTATSANSKQPIQISCCENVIIENATISTNSSDGLYLGVAYSESVIEQRTKNIKIENCIFTNCARNGIVVNSGDNILINNCLFNNINTYTPGHGIDVEFEAGNANNELYCRNLNVTNCYAKDCKSLINVYPTDLMYAESSVNVDNCTCDNSTIIVHGASTGVNTEKISININNIYFKNYNTRNYCINIRNFTAPKKLSINNIIFDEYTGTISTSSAEYGDIFIDASDQNVENVSISNIKYINDNRKHQTFKYKFTTANINMTVKDSLVEMNYTNIAPYNVKFINCNGEFNSNVKGNNAYFKVLELYDNDKRDFYIFSTSWLHVTLSTDSISSTLTITKSANSYISKGRIVTENGKKYLELFTTRVYSFPFIYKFKDIPNGIDKNATTALDENTIVEVNVTSA